MYKGGAIILLGAPGSGKGTQAAHLAAKFSIPHISTGEIFRSAAASGSAFGLKVKEIIDRGNLVPDELTIKILEDRLKNKDCVNGFILDGFPRTLPQAEKLGDLLKAMGKRIETVIYFSLKEASLLERLLGRRSCPACGRLFNIHSDKIAEGLCLSCGGKLVVRADDNEDTVRTRFSNYIKLTRPIVEYYMSRKMLLEVDASGSAKEVSLALDRVLA